jgi:hypothetical protein
MKEDTTRDYTRPFSDSHRLTRIVFDTVFMVLFSINDLYSTASQFSSNRVYALFSTSAILIAWLYCLALTFVSRRYTLPNRWGWALNIHLFVFYSVSLSVSLYRLWQVFQHQHGIISLSQGLPLFFAILFTADLFYTTGSIDQGPPFLDDEGKETADISVASIFSFLYFSWATPLVDRVYNNPNIKDKDLPRLPPIYRSHNIFYIFGQHRSKGLVYRIVKANKKAIFLQSVTTAVAAVLYYLPAFFLNRFLALIQEMDEGNKDEFSTVKGIMIICGLSLSLMLLSLVVGQLYYWSEFYIQYSSPT